MPVTHRFPQKENLDAYRTWLIDTDPASLYFRVTNVPEMLTAGRNAFLINGSPYLVPHTPVKVEVKDSEGTVLYSAPIKNYTEGLARVVSIEVYSDTPAGLGTITILGHVKSDVNGTVPPDEFVTAYNVRWQKRIMIAPTTGNSTPVRLYHRPIATVNEILNPFRKGTVVISQVTGSGDTRVSGVSLENAIDSGNPAGNPYMVIASDPIFVKNMEGGLFSCTVDGVPFSSSISTVVNNTIMQIDNGPQSGSIFKPFLTGNFTMSFTGSPLYAVTEYTKSFADITLKNLTTFSGDIYRVKTFVTSIDSPGNPELIADTRLEAADLMTTSSYMSGEQKIRTGYFTDTNFVNRYWTIGLLNPTSSLYNPG